MAKLTLKQQRFADEYIISGNATEAYLKAGYAQQSRASAEANARKLLGNYSVKTYIDERLSELNSTKIADQDEVLQFFTSVMRGEVLEPYAIGVGNGVQKMVDVVPSVATRKSAAVELAKRYGLSVEKVDVSLTASSKLSSILEQLEGDSNE